MKMSDCLDIIIFVEKSFCCDYYRLMDNQLSLVKGKVILIPLIVLDVIALEKDYLCNYNDDKNSIMHISLSKS